MNDKIYVAYAPDDNYINITLVSMTSLVENNLDKEIEFLILYSALKDANIKKLETIKKYKNITIRFLNIDENLFKDLPLSHWVTVQAWFRVLIPDLCPELDKVLYLDGDTLINGSLNELWHTNIDGKYLAAVKDIVNVKQNLRRLKMKSKSYFNSGVLLINCKKFREEQVLNKIKTIVSGKKYKIIFCDQDTLNIIADTDKIELPMKYDYMEMWWHNGYFEYYGEEEKLYLEAREKPVIIHLSGIKPYNKRCKHSQKENWWNYAKLTDIYQELVSYYESTPEPISKKSMLKFIFEAYSEHKNNIKWRVINILGFKIKIKLRPNSI